ncbi:related to ribosomal protein YmL40, mitochondrial [Rhynchosporium secalis]|uniref:Related to ribosomal protein YmL40, mitochondrial n=1 Tax=Rhynchosporium secalis TaxID=38038 RepID=A0A1E1M7U0_RHYSE|nr:related to ribosomal protein YmL40, mitochondrial [Rhynchosporium secalis]
MQKVFRHTVLAEKQAARRSARRLDKDLRLKWKNRREQNNYHRKDETKQIKEARFARREDYELGPLAPRRDVGDKTDTYGAVSLNRMQGRTLHGKEKDEILKFWGGKHLTIVKNDRVVILEGRDKGKIGVVKTIDKLRAECTVIGLNLMDVQVPKYMISKDEADQRPVRTIEQPVSLKSVRLVVPIKDSETGPRRDVIVKVIRRTPPFKYRNGTITYERYIPGMRQRHQIPWPEVEEKVFQDYPTDTLRMDVETKTFVPSLLTPPMPSSVIDELRNKYSIFRTRHEAEYLEAKQKEEDEKLAKKKSLAKKMRTPLNEANRKARKGRKKLGKVELTPDMLEKIGQVIADSKNLCV